MTVSVPSVPTVAPTSSFPGYFSTSGTRGSVTQPRTLPTESDTTVIVPMGPPPRTCSVMEPSSTFCMLPIMEAAVRQRPKAAVALGDVF